MAKYFTITENSADTFRRMTGLELDCAQVTAVAHDGNVYVAVEDSDVEYLEISLDMLKGGE